MSRRARMARPLSHPSRRRRAWKRIKNGVSTRSLPAVPEWRYRDWEYRTGRLR